MSTFIPNEIINHILSFRESHPVAKAFKDGILPLLTEQRELSSIICADSLGAEWICGLGASQFIGTLYYKEDLVCSGSDIIKTDYETIIQHYEENEWNDC